MSGQTPKTRAEHVRSNAENMCTYMSSQTSTNIVRRIFYQTPEVYPNTRPVKRQWISPDVWSFKHSKRVHTREVKWLKVHQTCPDVSRNVSGHIAKFIPNYIGYIGSHLQQFTITLKCIAGKYKTPHNCSNIRYCRVANQNVAGRNPQESPVSG